MSSATNETADLLSAACSFQPSSLLIGANECVYRNARTKSALFVFALSAANNCAAAFQTGMIASAEFHILAMQAWSRERNSSTQNMRRN